MRTLIVVGMISLSPLAGIGMSCEGSGGRGPGETGGQGAGDIGGGIASGGSDPGGSGGSGTSGAGGSGTSGAGGRGTSGAGGSSVTRVVLTPGGYRTWNTLKGPTVSRVDEGGSTITLETDRLCAKGNVVQKTEVNAERVWGAGFGWHLNQPKLPDGSLGDRNGADLSAFSWIVVGVSGTTTGLNLKLGLEVNEANGAPVSQYCTSLPLASGKIALSSLQEGACFGPPGGTAFNPATLQPHAVGLGVVADWSNSYTFDLCVTQLEFE